MKLVIAVVQDNDSTRLINGLAEANYRSTKLASTGGFLKQGNTTLMIGCQEEDVEEVLNIIKSYCSEDRMKDLEALTSRASVDLYTMGKFEIGGATVFVLPVDSFHQF